MRKRGTRLSGVSVLAGAVLVLLPALAWLQYTWLDQIADADRDRRARTLQTAAGQLAQEFDAEIGKAVFALQLEPASVEQDNWSRFADKYQVWADSAASPRIVKSVYFVEPPVRGRPEHVPALRRWNNEAHTFDRVPWPSDLDALRTRFIHEGVAVIDIARGGPANADEAPREVRVGRGAMQRMIFPPTATGADQSVIMPVLRITTPPPTVDDPRPAPAVTLLGFTVIRFDLSALGQEVLPALVRRHLYTPDGHTDYAVAIVSRSDPSEVIYESYSGSATAAVSSPDVTVSLLGPTMGQFLFMGRADRPGAPPPPPPSASPGPAGPPTDKVVVNVIEAKREDINAVSVQRTTFSGEGQWRLVAKHRAGSLEAAVDAARIRNFALSSGILALLATAIGLIVVSARRADRLARQQLEFVAAVSHELRTPVSVIGAAAVNLADGLVEDPARVKTYGSTIQSEARRLGETVERVLQLSGIAAGRAAASYAALDVPSLVEDAVAATRAESDAAGVTVEVDIAGELRQASFDPNGVQRVVGDAAALRSAIQNLISNAVKYGGDAHWVRVTATPLAPSTIRITVADHGLGIAADDRKHIFEPFYRGREAVSRQIQGSGLGLHLVQRIVEAHGGTVTVQSEVARGSLFTIDLPSVGMHDKASVRRQAGQRSAGLSQPGLKPGPS